MQHQRRGRKLGKKKDQRKALLKGLANNLIQYEKIETSEAKAKELRPKIEKLITRAKNKTLTNRRFLNEYLQKTLAKKLIDEIAPRYLERRGGYTRIIKLGPRRQDASPRAIIEFV